MTDQTKLGFMICGRSRSIAKNVAVVSLAAITLVGCRGHLDRAYFGGEVPTAVDHDEMHPIVVSKQPTTISVSVRRGSYGLVPGQQARIGRFLTRYRSRDMGDSKLIVSVPSGSSNEVEAVQAVAELRHMIADHGFDATTVRVMPYQAARGSQPPIRISYMRYVAEGPECGNWPSNLARQFDNRHYENYGCADQKNFAAMVANPADLLGPRTMTPRSERRRRKVWGDYINGRSTGAQRSNAETAKTQGDK
ncbi:MAG: CpaD family pilus assembly protein [Hyphomicrobiaceae bacterium]